MESTQKTPDTDCPVPVDDTEKRGMKYHNKGHMCRRLTRADRFRWYPGRWAPKSDRQKAKVMNPGEIPKHYADKEAAASPKIVYLDEHGQKQEAA